MTLEEALKKIEELQEVNISLKEQLTQKDTEIELKNKDIEEKENSYKTLVEERDKYQEKYRDTLVKLDVQYNNLNASHSKAEKTNEVEEVRTLDELAEEIANIM